MIDLTAQKLQSYAGEDGSQASPSLQFEEEPMMQFIPKHNPTSPLPPAGIAQFSVTRIKNLTAPADSVLLEIEVLFENLSGRQLLLSDTLSSSDAGTQRLQQCMSSLGLYNAYAAGDFNLEDWIHRSGFAEIDLVPVKQGFQWQVARYFPAADFI